MLERFSDISPSSHGQEKAFYWLQRRKIRLVCNLLSGCILRRWVLSFEKIFIWRGGLTHTLTHTGKCADGNNGTNRLRPHPFWTKKRRKASYSRGRKTLRQLVRMRSAVRICLSAPKTLESNKIQGFFFCQKRSERLSDNQIWEPLFLFRQVQWKEHFDYLKNSKK